MSYQSSDVFQLNLNSLGAKTLLRTCTIINSVLIIAIIWSIVSVIAYLLQVSRHYQSGSITTMTMIIQAYIIPIISILQILLGLVQLYFSFKYAQKTRQSILLNDTDLFNQAFIPMQKGWIVSLLVFIISLVITIYYLYYMIVY